MSGMGTGGFTCERKGARAVSVAGCMDFSESRKPILAAVLVMLLPRHDLVNAAIAAPRVASIAVVAGGAVLITRTPKARASSALVCPAAARKPRLARLVFR